MNKGSFRIYNFGCKVNQDEGGAVAALFVVQGWRPATDDEDPDLLIVNTCTVTQVADKKARNLIRRLSRQYPRAILAVCGCYAQRDADEVVALPGVHIVAGVEERARLPQLIKEHQAQGTTVRAVGDVAAAHEFQSLAEDSVQPRARAYLKIEDGCDQFCHYCIIPHVRGPVRSLAPELAVARAERLLAAGHRELVLSGIHIGAYGSDLGRPDALCELIESLVQLPGLLRLRLGSVEPQQFSERLLTLIGTEAKLCRHLHIPLQSGCDTTLHAMGRRYDTNFYYNLLQRLRKSGGDIAFTSDVMVGFPGESDADFQRSYDFCARCGFAALHVFPYSRRAGTPAADFPAQVRQAVKTERAAALAKLAADSAAVYAQRYVGVSLTMLAEEQITLDGTQYWRGHSDNYLPLLLAEDGEARAVYNVVGVMHREGGLIVKKT